ncbi:MAG TPA: DUF488 family protein [Aliidongia sp.]|nr:DUF488 family protein [Aliidongia sp.]
MIEIKRVYDAPAPNDGLRILVDRLWPRGLSKEAAHIDIWAKELAPTPDLRKWFDHRPERFAEFARLYRDELRGNSAVGSISSQIGSQRATLLYAARDRAINHAAILVDYFLQSR